MVETLEWSAVVSGSSSLPYWVHRTRQPDLENSNATHTHLDFNEMFWIEAGEAVHEINGERTVITPGDVVFIRACDEHRFVDAGSEFEMVNLAVPESTVSDLAERYGSDGTPWSASAPQLFKPVTHDWIRINRLGDALGYGRPERLRLDHFLTDVVLALRGPVLTERPVPDWLSDAIQRWCGDPTAMQSGLRGLASLAGYSRPYVSRTLKGATGRRATDVINEMRIEKAAALLRMSDLPIVAVACECGLPNIGHFYKVFRDQFNTTPRAYRLSYRRLTAGTT